MKLVYYISAFIVNLKVLPNENRLIIFNILMENSLTVGEIAKFVPKITMRRGLHPMVIKRNNMKDKNADLDRWISKLRCPYERTFRKQNKQVRYKGIVKNQGAEFLYAVAYNFRRLLVLNPA